MPGKYDTYIDASNGANLVTTIDTTIQKALEKQVMQSYLDNDPLNRVTGIVMDVNTGAILAMATYPSFDLNDPFTLDPDSEEKLEASVKFKKVFVSDVFSGCGTNIGPGMIGVYFMGAPISEDLAAEKEALNAAIGK